MPSVTSPQIINKLHSLLPIAAMVLAILFWGLSFAGMRIVLRELSPMVVMWCRMISAFIFILPFIKKLIPENYQKGDWKLLVPMVLFQPCLYFFFETKALMLTTSTQAGVIAAAVPIFAIIGSLFFFKEVLSRAAIAGLAISILGVVLLTVSQGSSEAAPNPVLGNLLELAATIFATGNILIIKKLSGRYRPLTLIAMQIIAGVIFFTPGFFQLIKTDPAIWSLQLVLILLYLGVFVSLTAFALYYWTMTKLTIAKASTFINLIPVVVILTGWIFLGESLTPIQLLAATGVIIGVMLSQRAVRQSKIPEHQK
ncbi:MAG: DMT family transporter [Spirochaetales bacterium]|nr:DMT family transporter [Spirochaetales bacterium]